MNYANWAEFAELTEVKCRFEIKVAIDDRMYYNMYDWCLSYDSNGIFYCSMVVDTDYEIHGAFYFSEYADAVLFALKWSNLNNV